MLNAEQSQILEAESKGKPNTIPRLSWLERFGYGSGDMAYNIVFQFVNAYLLFIILMSEVSILQLLQRYF
ncbi:hypothetical protein AAAC51_25775 [Priestia megaterium]